MHKWIYCQGCGKRLGHDACYKNAKRCRACANLGSLNPAYGKHHKGFWLGKKLPPRSEATKKKIGNSNKGKPNFFKGKQRTEENRNKLRGENCHLWKGGITPLAIAIRGMAESVSWRNQIFKRDGYRCQSCGDDKGGNLEAHHIKAFAFLFREFLSQYSQFSPIDDKETLVRLAISYTPFWDINNGKTLCDDCHNKVFIQVAYI